MALEMDSTASCFSSARRMGGGAESRIMTMSGTTCSSKKERGKTSTIKGRWFMKAMGTPGGLVTFNPREKGPSAIPRKVVCSISCATNAQAASEYSQSAVAFSDSWQRMGSTVAASKDSGRCSLSSCEETEDMKVICEPTSLPEKPSSSRRNPRGPERK